MENKSKIEIVVKEEPEEEIVVEQSLNPHIDETRNVKQTQQLVAQTIHRLIMESKRKIEILAKKEVKEEPEEESIVKQSSILCVDETINVKQEPEIHIQDELPIPEFILERIKIEHQYQRLDESEENKFQCEKCLKYFSTIQSLENHSRTHERDSYNCDQCSKSFDTKLTLALHKATHQGGAMRCYKCKQFFKSKHDLIHHLKSHDMKVKSTETAKANQQSYMLTHQEDREVFACDLRESKFKNKRGLDESEEKSVVEQSSILCVDERINIIQEPEIYIQDELSQQKIILERVKMEVQDPSERNSDYKCNKKKFQCEKYLKYYTNKLTLKTHKDKGDSYNCDQCSRTFETRLKLTLHKRTHQEKNIKCDKCEQLFKTKSHLAMHQKSHELKVSKVFECAVCSKMFNKKDQLKNHMLTHQEDCDVFRSDLCESKFKNNSDLDDPEEENAVEQSSILCVDEAISVKQEPEISIQDELSQQKITLERVKIEDQDQNLERVKIESQDPSEKNSNKSNEKFQCEKCLRYFSRKDHLKRHQKVHEAERNIYDCDQCLSSFDTRFKLANHKVTHQERNIKCGKCDQLFKSMRNLTHHQKSHVLKVFECTVCTRRFNRKTHLQRHMITHQEHRELYSCDHCESKFMNKYGLELHIMSKHIQVQVERKFLCDLCLKSFNNKDLLRTHMSSHIFEYCSICYKKISKVSLYLHMKHVHGNSLKLPCPMCPKVFKTRLNLKLHIAAHEMKFKCKMCDQKFARNQYLISHMKWHADPNVYSCNLCNISYKRLDNLKRHKYANHHVKKIEIN